MYVLRLGKSGGGGGMWLSEKTAVGDHVPLQSWVQFSVQASLKQVETG